MFRLRKLFRSASARPTRRSLGIEGLEGRDVPTTLVVNTLTDVVDPFDNVLSIREAINLANNNPAFDTIRLPAGELGLTLTGIDNTPWVGDLDVTRSMTFVGAGPSATVISGKNNSRLFDVLGDVRVKFSNLALVRGGNAASDGGAIQALAAHIELNNVEVIGNVGRNGGAVNVENGSVSVLNSRFLSNSATGEGGAIRAGNGLVLMLNSTVSGNDAGLAGGGIRAKEVNLTDMTVSGNVSAGSGGGIAAGHATLFTSTVSGNTAASDGGGIKADRVGLSNTTVSGNTARWSGGGIQAGLGGNILNSTIAFNHADGVGGGAQAVTGAVRVKNTIIANNTAGFLGRDVFGLFDSLGHNLIRDPYSGNAGTDFADPANADILGVDPKLGPLANNGGPTKTHALLAGSAAIDHGDSLFAPQTDQRGFARARDGNGDGLAVMDIGAFEYVPLPFPIVWVSAPPSSGVFG